MPFWAALIVCTFFPSASMRTFREPLPLFSFLLNHPSAGDLFLAAFLGQKIRRKETGQNRPIPFKTNKHRDTYEEEWMQLGAVSRY